MSIETDNHAQARRRPRPAWLSLGVVFALALLLALMARLPASLVLAGVDRWVGLPDTVAWQSADGSVWHGGIQGLETPAGPFGQLRWDLRPGALFLGEVGADIHWVPPGGGDLRGHLRLTGDSVELTAVTGSLPATALHQWDTGIPLVLDGRLQTSGLELRIRRDGSVANAAGRITWENAAAGLPRPLPLGEQRATIRHEEQRLRIDLDAAPAAELGMTGTIRLDLRTQPPAVAARVILNPRADADAAIARLLDNNLALDDQGRYLWTTGPTP